MHLRTTKDGWLVLTVLGLVACGEGGAVRGPSNLTAADACNPEVSQDQLNEARGLFDANVLPVMQTQCASCHAGANAADGPDFLGAGPAEFHDALAANKQLVNTPKNSLLVLKGAHTGPALTPSEAKATREWIQLRSGGDCDKAGGNSLDAAEANKPTTLEDALARFNRCMQLFVWENTGAARIAEQSSSEGPCRGCHNAGLAGVWMSGDPAAMWEINRRAPYVLKWITGRFGADGALEDLAPSGRLCAKGDESSRCNDPLKCHPRFTCSVIVKANIDKFLEETLALYRDFDNDC